MKQTDEDGRFEYSQILSVKVDVEENQFRLSSNPVNDVLEISFLGKNKTKEIFIYDSIGNLILNESSEQNQIAIDVSQLKSGVYILKINENKRIKSSKFIKI